MDIQLKIWRDKKGIHIRHSDGVWNSFPDEAAIAQYVKERGGNYYDDIFREALKVMTLPTATVKLADATKTESVVSDFTLTKVDPVVATATKIAEATK